MGEGGPHCWESHPTFSSSVSSYSSINSRRARPSDAQVRFRRTFYRFGIVLCTITLGVFFSCGKPLNLTINNDGAKLPAHAGLQRQHGSVQQLVEFRVPKNVLPGGTIHVRLLRIQSI